MHNRITILTGVVIAAMMLAACQKTAAEPATETASVETSAVESSLYTENETTAAAIMETEEQTTQSLYRYMLETPYGDPVDVTNDLVIKTDDDGIHYFIAPGAVLTAVSTQFLDTEEKEARFFAGLLNEDDQKNIADLPAGAFDDTVSWILCNDGEEVLFKIDGDSPKFVSQSITPQTQTIDGSRYVEISNVPLLFYAEKDGKRLMFSPGLNLQPNGDEVIFHFDYSDDANATIDFPEASEDAEQQTVPFAEGTDVSSLSVRKDGEDAILSDVIEGTYLLYLKRDTCPDCIKLQDAIVTAMDASGSPYITVDVQKDPKEQDTGCVMSSETVKLLGVNQIPAVIRVKDNIAVAIAEHPHISQDASEVTALATR